MFNYELPLEPSVDYFQEYRIPERIEEICKDILKKGRFTQFSGVYDALFELAEEQLIEEVANDY